VPVADGFNGVPFRDYLTVEYDAGDTLAKDDFPFVIEAARLGNAAQFGSGADRR
jgi:hypothetical protein